MLPILVRHPDARIETWTDLGDLGGVLTGSRALVRVDAECESPEGLDLLSRHFALPPISLADLSKRNQRPKIEESEEYAFLVIHALRRIQGHEPDTEEIDVALRRNAPLTAQARPVILAPRVDARDARGPRCDPMPPTLVASVPAEVSPRSVRAGTVTRGGVPAARRCRRRRR